MSFAVTNLIYVKCPADQAFHKKSNKITLLIDAALIVSAAVIGGLILAGIIKLPTGFGSAAYALIGVSAAILIADMLAFLIAKRSRPHERPATVLNPNDKLSKLPKGVYAHVLSFLDEKDIAKVKRVNKRALQVATESEKERAAKGGWFKLDPKRLSDNYLVGYNEAPKRHVIYVGISENTIKRTIVDKNYYSRDELADTYQLDLTVKRVGNDGMIIAKLAPNTFWVSAREWRGNTLATWGHNVEYDMDLSVKRLFYETFAQPST